MTEIVGLLLIFTEVVTSMRMRTRRKNKKDFPGKLVQINTRKEPLIKLCIYNNKNIFIRFFAHLWIHRILMFDI